MTKLSRMTYSTLAGIVFGIIVADTPWRGWKKRCMNVRNWHILFIFVQFTALFTPVNWLSPLP